MKTIIPLCNENAPRWADLLKGTPRTPPTPCRGPDCPDFNGGWCPYLQDGGTFEVYTAVHQIKSSVKKEGV